MEESSLSVTVESALRAFSSDISYAVAIVSTAVGIQKKRRAWQLKGDLRRAEAEARALCEQASPFLCMNQSPCGIGSCKFAVDEFALLKVPKCRGTSTRPQTSTGGTYSLEAALIPLVELRASIIK